MFSCVCQRWQHFYADQCDQIGRFLKVLCNKISSKTSNFFGYFEKPHSYVKTCMATSWVTFGNIWATFYSNIWSYWCWPKLIDQTDASFSGRKNRHLNHSHEQNANLTGVHRQHSGNVISLTEEVKSKEEEERNEEVKALVDCGGRDLGFCDMSSKYPG